MNRRFLAVLPLSLLALTLVLALWGAAVQAAPAAPERFFIRPIQLDLKANDLVYDAGRDVLWASSPADAGSHADSVTPIGRDGAIGAGIPVGSEPNRLALSADGRYLYVGLDGERAVRRVDLTTGTAGLEWSLGESQTGSCGPLSVQDMAVPADDPHTVVISRRTTSGCSPYNEGVVVYTDGVMRPEAIIDDAQINVLEPSSDPATFYGYTNENSGFDFHVMATNANGITTTTKLTGLLDGYDVDMVYADGAIYATSGAVVDVDTLTLAEPFEAWGLVVPDPVARRVYFIDTSYYRLPLFRAFDMDTRALLFEAEMPPFPDEPGSHAARAFVGLGDNLFAFISTDNSVYLLTLFEGYEVSGRVAGRDGNSLDGVVVSAGPGYSDTTAGDGTYTLGLPAGSFTLTVTREGYAFDPPSRQVTVPPNLPGQDFVGWQPVYTITGHIVDEAGQPLPGVYVRRDDTDATYSLGGGVYTFHNLPPGQYRIAPRSSLYTFSPAYRIVDVPPDGLDIDFVAHSPLKRAYLPTVR